MDGSRDGMIERDEVLSVLFMVLLFVSVLAGREIGSIYSSYGEVSELTVVFHLSEEEVAGYVRDVLRGEPSGLTVGMALTLPSLRKTEIVTQLPDYARRWFISVSVSPIVVHQPEVSDVEISLIVEGETLQTSLFRFEREKVPYLNLIDRNMTMSVDDVDRLREVVSDASDAYSGEVKLTLSGRALIHLLFLEAWLPFSTTRHILVRIPHVNYVSSGWVDLERSPTTEVEVGREIMIQFEASNPTRVHSVYENVTVRVYKEGIPEPVHTESKEAAVAPSSEAFYFFRLALDEPGVYHYSLEVEGGFSLPREDSPRLRVSGG